MVKRLGGQISVGWVSIVLDYSPLLLINSREREINICIATCKICRESGEGECGGGEKKACGETGVEMTIMFNMTRDIPFYPPQVCKNQ